MLCEREMKSSKRSDESALRNDKYRLSQTNITNQKMYNDQINNHKSTKILNGSLTTDEHTIHLAQNEDKIAKRKKNK